MKVSSRLAVATSSCLSAHSCASRMLLITDLLSSSSSRSMSSGGTISASLSEIRCSRPIWPMERSVVPPILRTRSAISSVVFQDFLGLLVEQQVVIAEMWSAHVPMEVLGLEIERETVGEKRIERRRNGVHRVRREIGRVLSGAATCTCGSNCLTLVTGHLVAVARITRHTTAGKTRFRPEWFPPPNLARNLSLRLYITLHDWADLGGGLLVFSAGVGRRGVGRRERCLNDIWLRKPRRGLGGPRGDAAWVTRCGGACQAGEARALAAARRVAAQRTSARGRSKFPCKFIFLLGVATPVRQLPEEIQLVGINGI